MARFFKRYRLNFLKDGKTIKYFKYAVGEIILVVLGILIALAINKWNERSKNRDMELIYLNRLTTNLAYDVNLYKQIMSRDSALIDQLDAMISGDSISIASRDIGNYEPLYAGYHFTSNRTTIDNIVSAGKIEIIRSNFLLEKIFLYYRTTDDIAKGVDKAIADYNRNVFGPLVIGLSRRDGSNPSEELFNAVVFKKDLIFTQLEIHNSQLNFAQNLIKEINDEVAFIKD
jgi:hypothetical protein